MSCVHKITHIQSASNTSLIDLNEINFIFRFVSMRNVKKGYVLHEWFFVNEKLKVSGFRDPLQFSFYNLDTIF